MWKYSRAAFTFLISVRSFVTRRLRGFSSSAGACRGKKECDFDFADALLAKKLAEAVGRGT
jgi:hypothetical protein